MNQGDLVVCVWYILSLYTRVTPGTGRMAKLLKDRGRERDKA
jgi:hypothetical protein